MLLYFYPAAPIHISDPCSRQALPDMKALRTSPRYSVV